MFSRLINVLFFGSLFALIPLCIAMAGILEGYIHFYEIRDCGRRVFFNPFFYDTIIYPDYRGWFFLLASFIAGILVIYPPFFAGLFRILYLLLIVISLTFFMPSIGFEVGRWLFYRPQLPVTLITGDQVQVDVIYTGREGLHFLSPDKDFPSIYRWEAIRGGEEQRCYRFIEDSKPMRKPIDTSGAPAEEAAAVGVEPLPQKKSMFEVLMKRLFPNYQP